MQLSYKLQDRKVERDSGPQLVGPREPFTLHVSSGCPLGGGMRVGAQVTGTRRFIASVLQQLTASTERLTGRIVIWSCKY